MIGEIYNIGTQKERSVLDVVTAICEYFKVGPDRIQHVKDRAFNDQRYYICDKKLLALGWAEEVEWEKGLAETIKWYLDNGFASYWENGDVEAALVVRRCPALGPAGGRQQRCRAPVCQLRLRAAVHAWLGGCALTRLLTPCFAQAHPTQNTPITM